MKKTFTILTAALMLLAMFASPMRVMGQTRDTKTDVMFAKGFGSYTTNSYGAAGTDYSAVANSTNATGVTYAMQVFNGSTGAVRGNKSGSANYSCRNTSTYSGYYISSVSLTVSGGTLDGSTSNRSVVYFGSSAYSNPSTTPTGTTTAASPSSSGQTTLTWTNTDQNVSYFLLYDLKTSGTALSANATTSLNVVWTQKSSTPSCATPTFSPAEGTIVAGNTVAISTETSGATIYYTTNGSDPTTSSTQYTSAITVNSNMTIKAIAVASGYDNSSVASASYVVVDHAGTAADPYSIADAYTAIDANTGITNVYVAGIISQVDSYSSQYNSITYWISEDGTTTSDQLEVYSGKGLNNTDFTSINDVEVGAEVVVYGTLKKYNNVYEFDKNNYLTSYTAPQHDVATPTFSPAEGTYSTAQSVTISCATAGADIYYTTDGTDPDANSTQYTSAISVSATTTIKAKAFYTGIGSNIATATYHINSQADPYTVTQALNFPAYQYPAPNIYVHGIVSTAATSLSNGTLTYYISADGTTTDELEVYKGKGLDDEAFTAVDDIQVGDIVTIYGEVQIYNNTIEFGGGNYLVSFERPAVPTINANDITLDYDATSGEIEYTIENPVPGTSLTATLESGIDWISNIYVGNGSVTFDCDENNGSTDRTATITLAYTGATSKDITVTQRHFVIDYAVLPFEWGGGASVDLLALDGVTANSLGSDYAASNAPYLVKFDGTGDYIQVKCDQQPGKVTIGVKMIGGGNTSTITVQGSADGETFTDIEVLTISGKQNDVLNLETTNAFAATDRYVRMLFTKGSNVGVGPITIAQVTNDPVIVADNSVELEYNETSGSISYSITNPTSATLTASSEADWISNITVGANTVTFSATTNEGSADRTATITLSYTGATDKTVTVTQGHYVAPITPTTYTLATSIVSGKTYIITSDLLSTDNIYAMGGQNSNNRAAICDDVSKSGNTVTVGTADVREFVITNEGTLNEATVYSIYDATESGYLYAASSSSNYLRTESTLDNNGKWTISIDSEGAATITAQGSNTHNVMRFNQGSHLFSCYADGQQDVYLYVKDEPTTSVTYYYSVNGTLSAAYTCAIGSTKTLETGTDLYSNFTFAGWTTNANDVSSPISLYTFNDEGPVTFYAVYAHNSNNYTRVFNETATADIDIIGPSIIPSFGLLDMDTYEIDLVGASLCLIIEEGGQLIYSGEEVRVDYQKNITAPSGTWGQNDNTGWYAISSPTGRYSKTSEINDFEYFVADARRFDFFAYGEKCGWYNKLDAEHYVREVKAGYGYLYAREVGTMVVFHDDACHDDYNLTNLSYTSSRGTLAGLHCIGNPYTHNIYKGVGITGDMTTGYYALNEATGAWISTTDATAIVPTQAILVFVNKTDGTAAIHMTSDNSAPSSKANNDYIKFNVANSKYEDVAYAWFDKGEGLKKINHRNSEVPMLYIPRNNANYSIAYMSDNTDVFNLNFKAMTTGKYTLSVSEKGDFSYLHIYDRLTGEDIDMLNNDYSFIGAPSDNEARFIVRLSYSAGNGSDINTFAFQNGSDIIVNGEGELQIFDVMGRMVKSTVINGVETIAMPQGVYIFRLNENIQKIVVR